MWSKWSRPDNKCEGRRFRQCQNCLADGTCTPIPKFKQSCAGERFETLFYTNKPACSKYPLYPKTPKNSQKLLWTPTNSFKLPITLLSSQKIKKTPGKSKNSIRYTKLPLQIRRFLINPFFLEYFLSIEHGGNITIFDTRRGKINTLEGGIKGNFWIRN